MSNACKVCLAADDMSPDQVIDLARKVAPLCYAIKVNSAYHSEPALLEKLKSAVGETCKIWVDVKLHDIPNTVALSVNALAQRGADIITVHASGGVEMMRAAVHAVPRIEIFAVTILTSLSLGEVVDIYGGSSVATKALNLACAAKFAGVAGIVCSPQEVGLLSKREDLKGLKFVTPGVRSPGAGIHDQKRVGTPRQAIDDGASLLVVGREVTQAEDPVLALRNIEKQITSPLREEWCSDSSECFDFH